MIERIRELVDNARYGQLRTELEEMNTPDIAEYFEMLTREEVIKLFRILPKNMAADVFSYLSIERQQEIITSMTEREAAGIIDELSADDATDIMDEMPANMVKKILAQASPETRRDINHLLQYPEDSAGSIMTVEYVDLKENITVSQAIERIRRIGINKETIDVCYVLDANRKLLGTCALRYLLLSEPDEKIGNIMHEDVISINTLMDQEEVASTFKKYDFTTMPVVDGENRLVGIITVDDIVDIIEREATEDIEMMAAITPTDHSYMKTGIFETFRKRIPWLLLLMISATFTGGIIQHYEQLIAGGGYLILTAFIPMLMDTGGNCGSQASVSVIRSISLNEVKFADIFKVAWKEMRVAVLCGLTLSVANFAKLMLIDRVELNVALVVCLTLVVTVMVAKMIGAMLPMIAKQIGFDPAVMASPFITTIVDALSLAIYFQIAVFMLKL